MTQASQSPTRPDKTLERVRQEHDSPGATSAGGFGADVPGNDTAQAPEAGRPHGPLDSSTHTAERRGDAAPALPSDRATPRR